MYHMDIKAIYSESCPIFLISPLCLHLSLPRIFCVPLNFHITDYKVPISLSWLLPCVIYDGLRRKCPFKSERDYIREERDLAMLFGVATFDTKKLKSAKQRLQGKMTVKREAADRKVLLADDWLGALLNV